MDCLFCKIIAGKINAYIIHEDSNTIAFLDISPINKGHTLVVPKEHAINIFDMSSNSYLSVHKTVHKLAPVIKEAVGACGINIGMNNNTCAGQVIMHPHIHIIPRFEDDSFELWKGKNMTEDQLLEITHKINLALQDQ